MAQEEIIFKVGVDTGDSVQDVNKVGDAIENVGKDAKKTDGSFVNLRKELKNLTVQLQNLDPANKAFSRSSSSLMLAISKSVILRLKAKFSASSFSLCSLFF